MSPRILRALTGPNGRGYDTMKSQDGGQHDPRIQVIRALYVKDKHLAIGLEKVPALLQETLNKWTAGILTKDEFLREIRWYVTWNFNLGYYEKIFDFAPEHRPPIHGLNAPRGQEKPALPTIGLAFKKFENLENLVVDAKPTEGAAGQVRDVPLLCMKAPRPSRQ